MIRNKIPCDGCVGKSVRSSVGKPKTRSSYGISRRSHLTHTVALRIRNVWRIGLPSHSSRPRSDVNNRAKAEEWFIQKLWADGRTSHALSAANARSVRSRAGSRCRSNAPSRSATRSSASRRVLSRSGPSFRYRIGRLHAIWPPRTSIASHPASSHGNWVSRRNPPGTCFTESGSHGMTTRNTRATRRWRSVKLCHNDCAATTAPNVDEKQTIGMMF